MHKETDLTRNQTTESGEGYRNHNRLPDFSVPPRLEYASRSASSLLLRDVAGVLIVGIILHAIVRFFFVLPLFIPFWVGLMGWADAVREGGRGGILTIWKTTSANWPRAIGWFFLVILLNCLPFVPAIEIGILFHDPNPPSGPVCGFAVPYIMFGVMAAPALWGTAVLLILFSPMVFAFGCLSAWAIARSGNFKMSLRWAALRLVWFPVHWWIAGTVNIAFLMLSFVSWLGFYPILLVIPSWSALFWSGLADG